MKILIAPQAFKGTLSLFEAAEAIRKGAEIVFPDADLGLAPVADGGDGTLDVLIQAKNGDKRAAIVTDAIGNRVEVEWGILSDQKTAVIETARICGLSMIPQVKRNPLTASTFGVGEIIRAALDAGCRRFIVGLGGSATNDGGAGMAQALGARLFDNDGQDLPRGGAALARLHTIDIKDIDPRIQESTFIAACDVLNPLLGSEGASHMYSPQKGASAQMPVSLELSLKHFADIVHRQLGVDIYNVPGGGSAGGLGAGMMAFLGAELRSGIDLVMELLDFEAKLNGASLVITGEGCMEQQTVYHKAPFGVAQKAMKHGIPVLAVVGMLGKGYSLLHQHGIDAIIPLSFSNSLAAPSDSSALLAQATEEALRCIRIGEKIKKNHDKSNKEKVT